MPSVKQTGHPAGNAGAANPNRDRDSPTLGPVPQTRRRYDSSVRAAKRSLIWLREALERALTMTTDTILGQYLATQISNIDLMLESWPRGDAETAVDVLLGQVECEVSRELYGDDADGNRGEQQIRPCVIDRRLTQGTRGEAGQRYHERMWTAIATCQKATPQLLLLPPHVHCG